MRKKVFCFTISPDVGEQLSSYSKSKTWSMSIVVEKALKAFLGPVVIKEKVTSVPRQEITEEERLADWEWRKQQVKDGKLPVGMEVEYPKDKEGPDVYLTPEKVQEDKDFEDSIKQSLNEKES